MGTGHWPRSNWEQYLKGFPSNHEPDVRGRYKDLTAMFDVGKAVPTLKQEQDALTKFLIAVAPERELPKAEREKPFQAFPAVGSVAPDFSITDVEGGKFALADLKDKKALVLVFSRAHW
ncbi:MAG: redoxin domain-containing protein [Verrucomicrobia subdivision 3 bacterium]|nr:redoxin domain-containing protein [Limisphaerales bacterium]